MLSMPRFARVFLLALVLVTVPTAFYFYPSSSSSSADLPPSEVRLDQGGIDSDHWREPVPPPEQMQLEEAGLHLAEPESPAEMVPDNTEVEKEDERAWKQGTGMQDWGQSHGNVGGDTGFGRQQDEGGKGDSGESGGVLMSADEGSGTGTEEDVINGAVIMPHLGNATAKAELGRAAWRVLHLMTLRYPEKPTPDDRAALKSFFHLFSRLYPCGECAEHFQKMLKKYPPQTSSRKAASLWLCSIHNMVNERLGKPEFDCLTLDKTYDCGCNGTSSAAVPAATGSTALLDSAAD